MKQTKRYLAGLLAVLMLIGSIHIGGVAVDVNKDINTDEITSLEEMEIEEVDIEETEEITVVEEKQDISTGSSNSIISSESNDSNNLSESELGKSNELTESEESISSNDSVSDNNISFEESDLNTNEVETDDTNISAEEDLEVDLSETDSNETEEVETDNWELELVFYDSTVNNGKTPLTQIDWDASNGSYRDGETRVITVQINYKNTNTTMAYLPGELKLSINNLAYKSNSSSSAQLSSKTNIGANDSTHTGYDWNFCSKESDEHYVFENNTIIEKNNNFEGTIQIQYELTPMGDNKNSYYPYYHPEEYLDECTHSCNVKIQAILDNKIESNSIFFDYIRLYKHPWKRKTYTVKKTAKKVSSYDGLGKDASKYIWVNYSFTHTDTLLGSKYPNISAYKGFYRDKIPNECIVYSSALKLLEPDENGYYEISAEYNSGASDIYVGYPKEIYNEENGNLNIRNDVDLYGKYTDREEYEVLDSTYININLADYNFSYTGNLYGIKKFNDGSRKMRTQDIINEFEYNKIAFFFNTSTIYTGTQMTVKIGDDILFATSNNGEPVKLNDDEYYFQKVNWISSFFKNGNKVIIPGNKYDCELWVRYKDTLDYALYDSFKNPLADKTWNFKKSDGIVGFYFIIHNLEESLNNNGFIHTETVFTKKDIPDDGTLYNFNYLQVFFKDDEGNLILQNEPGLDSYDNLITKDDIATFDMQTYGLYLQRACGKAEWNYYDLPQPEYRISVNKKFNEKIIQDNNNEYFSGSCNLSSGISSNIYFEKDYISEYDKECVINGFRIYDLLPAGMELSSTNEEIINSLSISLGANGKYYGYIYDEDFNKLSTSELKELVETKVIIKKNWNNSGRTKIEIIGTFKKGIYMFGKKGESLGYSNTDFHYEYNFYIKFEDYLEYGNVWGNYCYANYTDNQKGGSFENYNSTIDDGTYDKDAVDIDEDGSTTDKLAYAKAQTTISSVISTHQDVQTSVKTDQSYYSTGSVQSSNNSEYEYKLRVRTGQNDVTNLVIYDSLEEYTKDNKGNFIAAHGNNKHWNGNLLGIDTSYAESKGYTVKTWYSENSQPDALYDDNGNINPEWKEFERPVEPVYSNGLKIKFSNNSRTYSSSDYVYIYYFKDGKYYRSPSIHGTSIAGKEIEIPSTDFYLYWHTSSTKRNYYGFSIDSIEPIKTDAAFTSTASSLPAYEISGLKGNDYPESMHNPYNEGTTNQLWHYTGETVVLEDGYEITPLNNVKSFAFEYLDSEGNPAILPANSLTYVLIRMKSPVDESITSLAYNGCWTQWNALDEFDRPVDFVTGINSNIVKISLPNSGRGSYIVKHEYYMRDYNGNLILENTYSENEVSNIVIDTIIKAEEQNHIEENNNKQYIFTEDSGDITIKENEVSEIVLKYVRNEEYGSYQVKHEYYVKEKDDNLTLENTVLEEIVPNVVVGTTIKADEQNHIENNNEKQYVFTEDTGDIIVEKDTVSEIVLKYIREQEYGSYVVKHEYYIRDFDGNLTLENTYSEDEIPDIIVGTIIKADEQEHILSNDEKEYVYLENTGDITIKKDTVSEITMKYVRDEEYTAELPNSGGRGNDWIIFNVIFFSLVGSSLFFIANKKRKN